MIQEIDVIVLTSLAGMIIAIYSFLNDWSPRPGIIGFFDTYSGNNGIAAGILITSFSYFIGAFLYAFTK